MIAMALNKDSSEKEVSYLFTYKSQSTTDSDSGSEESFTSSNDYSWDRVDRQTRGSESESDPESDPA